MCRQQTLGDGDVDQMDLALFQLCLGGGGCLTRLLKGESVKSAVFTSPAIVFLTAAALRKRS